jgi:hypothetical protein
VVRYRPIAFADFHRLGSAMTQTTRREAKALLDAAADLLAMACDEILLRIGDDEPRPLAEGRQTRFDEYLVTRMGWKADTAREAVLLLYANDIAVNDAALEVYTWMKGATAEAGGELLGEASVSASSSSAPAS